MNTIVHKQVKGKQGVGGGKVNYKNLVRIIGRIDDLV